MQITLPDGSTRKMGNKVPTHKPRGTFREFGSVPTELLIPRSEFDAVLASYQPGPMHSFLPPVKDQDGVGQCNPTAAVTGAEAARAAQGLPGVELSAADLYARINGGVDEGSMLEDALAEMVKAGVGTAATCGRLWKRGEYKPASDAERAKYRFLEASLCPTFDHCFSAVAQGFFLVTGIMWYDNYTPDVDGWLPRPAGNAGGHAIFGYKPTSRNGRYGIWHQNSWGSGWGVGGRFVIPESAYDAGNVGGWYAVRAVTDEGGVIPVEV